MTQSTLCAKLILVRAFLRRLLGVVDYPTHEPEAKDLLLRRVDKLEEDLDLLRGSVRRLRGHVTGGLRAAEVNEGATPSDPEAASGTQPSPRDNPVALAMLARRRAGSVPVSR